MSENAQSSWMMRKIQVLKTFILKEVVQVDDTPHRIALGCAIGVFVAFTPTIPIQMILTVAFCWLFRANKVVGLPAVWITNPATIIPIYFPQYALGCLITGVSIDNVDFAVLTQDHGSTVEYARQAWLLMSEIFWPLWIGSLIVSSLAAVATYYGTTWAIRKYRFRKHKTVSS